MIHSERSWQLFQETGLPVAYLLYAAAKTKEDRLVHRNQRSDHTGSSIQGKR